MVGQDFLFFYLPGAETAVLVGFHGLARDGDGQLGGGRDGNQGEEDELLPKERNEASRKRHENERSPTYQLHGGGEC